MAGLRAPILPLSRGEKRVSCPVAALWPNASPGLYQERGRSDAELVVALEFQRVAIEVPAECENLAVVVAVLKWIVSPLTV